MIHFGFLFGKLAKRWREPQKNQKERLVSSSKYLYNNNFFYMTYCSINCVQLKIQSQMLPAGVLNDPTCDCLGICFEASCMFFEKSLR